jgi:hypothetical protein
MAPVRMTDNMSAVASIALEKAQLERGNRGLPELTDEEAREIADEANRVATFGVGYAVDKKTGLPVQGGVGSDLNPSINHFASLKKRELQGHERPGSYERALSDIWKKNPEWCRRADLPKPEEAI